ncbi:hypothetical protein ACFTAO_37045 [Paenibacillus rhizoplanae]
MLKNTLLISLYSLLFAFPAPILLALLLNDVKNAMFKKMVQTITYLPHFISVVVVCGIVTNLLAPGNGIVNLLLEQLGLEKNLFPRRAGVFPHHLRLDGHMAGNGLLCDYLHCSAGRHQYGSV